MSCPKPGEHFRDFELSLKINAGRDLDVSGKGPCLLAIRIEKCLCLLLLLSYRDCVCDGNKCYIVPSCHPGDRSGRSSKSNSCRDGDDDCICVEFENDDGDDDEYCCKVCMRECVSGVPLS